MIDLDSTERELLADSRQAVLVTLRRDGRAQTSNVVFSWRDGLARVSVTAARAKTHNLRRDPRAVLHVLGGGFDRYLSLPCVAELSPIVAAVDDEVVDELADVYAHVAGAPHPDLAEFGRSMLDERRLVARLRPDAD